MHLKEEPTEYDDESMPTNYDHDDDDNNDNYQRHKTDKKQHSSHNRYRPKVLHNWTSRDILKLIAAVEKRRHLWDKNLPDYKLPKASTWQEISDGMMVEVTPDECKAKWTNLRVSFNMNLAKYRNLLGSHQDPGESKMRISWKYFVPMFFLEKFAELQPPNESSSTTTMSLVNILFIFSKYK